MALHPTMGKAAAASDSVIENRIFIGGIPASCDEGEVKRFLMGAFRNKGVKDVKIIADKSGGSKSFGFVTFNSKDAAQAILRSQEYHSLIFKDRKLNISPAVKRKSAQSKQSSNASVANGNSRQALPQPQQAPAPAPMEYFCCGHSQPQAPLFNPMFNPALCFPGQYAYQWNLAGCSASSGAGFPTLLAPTFGMNALHWPLMAPQPVPFLSAASLPHIVNTRPAPSHSELLLSNLSGQYNCSLTSDYSTCSDINNSQDASTDGDNEHADLAYSPGIRGAAPYITPAGDNGVRCLNPPADQDGLCCGALPPGVTVQPGRMDSQSYFSLS